MSRMGKGIAVLLMIAFGLGNQGNGQVIPWRQDLNTAQIEAAQTGRLVLVHFWATWCEPCKRLEKNVFSQPTVAAAMMAHYIPVKLDADQNADLARSFRIHGVPHDVILTPQGQLLESKVSPSTADAYITCLGQIATSYSSVASQRMVPPSSGNAIQVAQNRNPAYENLLPQQPVSPVSMASQSIPANPSPGQNTQNGPPAIGPEPNNPGLSQTQLDQQAPPYLNGSVRRPNYPANSYTPDSYPPDSYPPDSYPPPDTAPDTAPPMDRPQNPANGVPSHGLSSAPSASSMLPNHIPPLGLDGYCPVTLRNSPYPANDSRRWVQGDPRWGALHRGRTYLFAGEAERDLFLQATNADIFAPVLSGMDPVLAFDRHEMIPGKRSHGVLYRGLMFLFSSEATLQQFSQNPDYYANSVRQAMTIGQPMTTR
ncbi:MAG: thioredoxin family protein [Pirellulales bacterium]|nr:thioredoxin family protein [Pirellulales bacterium]